MSTTVPVASTAAGPDRSRVHPRRRRRLLRALGVTVVVLLLVWLGGAWYFSGEIYNGSLKVPEPSTGPTPDVAVLALGAGTATLAVTEDSPGALTADGTWGLWWEDGYGHIGIVIEQDAASVTRQLSVLRGTAPEVGQLVAVDRFAMGDTPEEILGLEYADVVVPGPLGDLPAWFVPAAETSATAGTWAVMVHGRAAALDETLRMLDIVHEAGLSALVVSYRNDPGAPADPSGQMRFGATEWEDVDAALAYAAEQGADEVVLIGFSMGGAASVEAMAHGQSTDDVVALVLDAPALDLSSMVDLGASQRTVPGTGLPLPPGLVPSAKVVAELRYGVDFDDFDHRDELAAVEVPVLVIHGGADDRVPASMVEATLRDMQAAGSPSRFLLFDGADHVGSWNVDTTAYTDAVDNLLAEVTG